jgi:ubiquinone/menaquinone biosynthesis C-methylase UbiE
MIHADHVNLIKCGIPNPGGVWVDFGSGTGAFTLALAELLGSSGEIYSVDKDLHALIKQGYALESRFTNDDLPTMHYLHSDFTKPIDLPSMDGAIIANALHFQQDACTVAKHLRNYLSPGGRFIIVEYNITRSNPWVPHPVPFKSWQNIALLAGFEKPQLLTTHESRTFREIYAALSINPDS